MNQGYKKLVSELEKPHVLRKGFNRKRRNPFSISDVRINALYDKYFSVISLENHRFTFIVEDSDFDEIVYLLRVHYQLWIEIKGFSITFYREFPKRFKLTREVNSSNHKYTPLSISQETVMELTEDPYGVINYNNGIPLTGKILIESDEVSPVTKPYLQINYEFLKAIH